jgi:serine/threonine protein kinase
VGLIGNQKGTLMGFLNFGELKSIGDYELLTKVGKGANSSVYKARHKSTGQIVAIKVLPRELSKDNKLYTRFEREFQIAAALDHPNLVKAFEFSQTDGRPYLIMEFVDGDTLGQQLVDHGAMQEGQAICIITQVGQALQLAHNRGLIHRDVKPDNILLRKDGRAKLTDLGLAKDILNDQGLTNIGMALGTPHYMPPEQYADAKRANIQSDIYSLAATLYASVTGQVPFSGCNSLDSLRKIVKGEVVAPRAIVPSLSEQVNQAILRAMSPDPDRRPKTCLDFLKELTREPIPELRLREAETRPQLARTNSGRLIRPSERRVCVRLPLTVGASCLIDTSVHESHQPVEENWPAIIQDISLGGLGLLLARRFDPGTNMTVDLGNGPGQVARSMSLTVMWVEEQGFGHWLTGCAFATPLTLEELDQYLQDEEVLSGSPA